MTRILRASRSRSLYGHRRVALLVEIARAVRSARDTWVLVATIVGSSMAFIDGMVVTLALPSIQREFHAGAGDVAWIVELYTLVIGSLMLIGGALADIYGRKRIFTIGTILFTIGSVGCAFAWSIPSMLVARVVQGLGGMLLIPSSLAILGAHFTGTARDRAIAAWSAFGALTSTIGPMVGGALIDSLGWRSVFWINVPLAAVVLYATAVHIEESRDEHASRQLDLTGAALVTISLAAITYALIRGSSIGWHSFASTGNAIAGVIVMAIFVARDRRVANPLVPPAVFASRTFGTINIATLLLYGALGANFYILPFVMIQAHGYNALQTAFATLPLAICMVALARAGTALARVIGMRTVLTIGPIIIAAGFVLLAMLEPNATYLTAFFPGILVAGIGLGLTVAPLTSTVIDSVEPEHVGIASGINNAVSRVAGLLAVAALTIIIAALYNTSLDRSLDAMHASPATRAAANAQRDRLGGARFQDPQLQRASTRAFERGFQGVAAGCAILALLAAVTDAFGIRNEELKNG
jgi:EmrB/QacA subfamily drug resistance transporter